MKKLDNKGVTLVELIVSFVIVTVAVVYFTKTLDVVVSLYKESNKLTDEFVEKNYAIRIAEALLDKTTIYTCTYPNCNYNLSTYADGYEITEIEEIPGTTVYKCTLEKSDSDITFLYTKKS